MIARPPNREKNLDQSDAKLRAALSFCVKVLKSQATQISRLSSLVAVLAGTVRGLDPTFDDVWEQKKVEIEQALLPSRQELISQYDELLRSIESGEIL
jgi:hypothetical protein